MLSDKFYLVNFFLNHILTNYLIAEIPFAIVSCFSCSSSQFIFITFSPVYSYFEFKHIATMGYMGIQGVWEFVESMTAVMICGWLDYLLFFLGCSMGASCFTEAFAS